VTVKLFSQKLIIFKSLFTDDMILIQLNYWTHSLYFEIWRNGSGPKTFINLECLGTGRTH